MESIRSILLIITAAFVTTSIRQDIALGSEGTTPGVIENSRYTSLIPLPSEVSASWQEFRIPPDLFDGARWDLADLRLLDAASKEVPYALRVRLPRSLRQSVDARIFNRGVTPEGAAELSLDLGESALEHNEVEVRTAGDGFRRRAVLEGSADGGAWNKLSEKKLLRFSTAPGTIQDDRFEYPPSRFRYLRLRVEKDAEVDREDVDIISATVRRTVEQPGQASTLNVQELQPREPSRNAGRIGSEWIIDLGGKQVPCQRLEFDIDDREFVRDYVLVPVPENPDPQSLGVDGVGEPYYPSPRAPADEPTLARAFSRFTSAGGTWRRAGESKPLTIELGEIRAGRKLKLFVADGANQPLHITGVRFVAAECVAVFAGDAEVQGPLTAYFGNPFAEPPSYDFARNLPEKLDPPPAQLTAQARNDNLHYVPPPKPPLPFTERFAWLIHCVLGVVSLALLGLIVQLGRRLISHHDARAAAT